MGTSIKSRKAELKKAGWVERSTIDESRLNEIVKEYESLGFEVRLEPLNLDELDKGCQKCYKNNSGRFKTVYVRKKHC